MLVMVVLGEGLERNVDKRVHLGLSLDLGSTCDERWVCKASPKSPLGPTLCRVLTLKSLG